MSLNLLLFLVSFQALFIEIELVRTVTVTDETQPSVINEKFPLLRIVTAFISDNWNLRITNLGNLESSAYLSRFNGGKTMVFTHGWRVQTVQHANGAATLGINNTYEEIYSGNFAGPKLNFIAVNWTAYNQDDYTIVITRLQSIANEIGDTIFNMATKSSNPINLNDWIFVGFSLGAHISGLISRRIKERSNGILIAARIIGLDPAGPILNYPIFSCFFPHLEKSDAKFVDIIHTNAGGYGTGWKLGHIDFWPNFGNNQPGCPRNNNFDVLFRQENLCSHFRSVSLYANQLYSYQTAFPAVRCSRNVLGQLQCTTDKTLMGYGADLTATNGDYYLITNGNSQDYDLGDNGIAMFFNKTIVVEEYINFL